MATLPQYAILPDIAKFFNHEEVFQEIMALLESLQSGSASTAGGRDCPIPGYCLDPMHWNGEPSILQVYLGLERLIQTLERRQGAGQAAGLARLKGLSRQLRNVAIPPWIGIQEVAIADRLVKTLDGDIAAFREGLKTALRATVKLLSGLPSAAALPDQARDQLCWDVLSPALRERIYPYFADLARWLHIQLLDDESYVTHAAPFVTDALASAHLGVAKAKLCRMFSDQVSRTTASGKAAKMLIQTKQRAVENALSGFLSCLFNVPTCQRISGLIWRFTLLRSRRSDQECFAQLRAAINDRAQAPGVCEAWEQCRKELFPGLASQERRETPELAEDDLRNDVLRSLTGLLAREFVSARAGVQWQLSAEYPIPDRVLEFLLQQSEGPVARFLATSSLLFSAMPEEARKNLLAPPLVERRIPLLERALMERIRNPTKYLPS